MQLPFLRILRILTILLAIVLAIVSFAGAFVTGVYERDAPSMAAQGAGQDIVNLFLVVPLLIVSFIFAARGSRLAVLVYAGTLFYILYSFIIYALGVHFNRLFLLYCATLGLSTYAFILVIIALRQQKPAGWFENAPEKVVSAYLFFVALVFFYLWLSSILPAIIQNTVPKEVADYGLLVNPVHVIDLAFVLPGLIIGSILIWRSEPMGYMIASVALVFMILLSIALAAMVIMVVARDISEDFTVAIVFGVLSLTSLLFSVLLFRRIGKKDAVK